MKSIRTNPSNHGPEGDERIRTAVPAPSDDPAYDRLTAADIDRALTVAENWGGWSFEEAELMARVLLFLADNARVSVELEDAIWIAADMRFGVLS